MHQFSFDIAAHYALAESAGVPMAFSNSSKTKAKTTTKTV
jgi:hypothetical protein